MPVAKKRSRLKVYVENYFFSWLAFSVLTSTDRDCVPQTAQRIVRRTYEKRNTFFTTIIYLLS